MLRTPCRAVLLTLAVGCSLDLADKTFCHAPSDCLDGHICQENVCTASRTRENSSAGASGAAPASNGEAGGESTSRGGSSAGEGPGSDEDATAGTAGSAGAEDGGAGGEPGCEPSFDRAETAEIAYLLHPNPPATNLRFGEAVAVDAGTIVVGTPGDEAVFIYVESDCGYELQAELSANDETVGAKFGNSVAIQGDTIVVGAPFAEIHM